MLFLLPVLLFIVIAFAFGFTALVAFLTILRRVFLISLLLQILSAIFIAVVRKIG